MEPPHDADSLLLGIYLPQRNKTYVHTEMQNVYSSFVRNSFPGGSDGKASVYNVGDLGSSPGLGRSPGVGNGNLLQYYCLENPMDRGAYRATVHGVAKSQT